MQTQCPHCGAIFDGISASDLNQLGECGSCGKNFIMHQHKPENNTTPKKLHSSGNQYAQRNFPEEKAKKESFTLSGFLSVLAWLGVLLFVFIGYIGLTHQSNVIGSGLIVGLVTLLFFVLAKLTKDK